MDSSEIDAILGNAEYWLRQDDNYSKGPQVVADLLSVVYDLQTKLNDYDTSVGI